MLVPGGNNMSDETWRQYTDKQFFKNKLTSEIVWLFIYQGPATTVVNYKTSECENIKNSEFKEQYKSIPSPYPCQRPKAHNPQFQSKWHCNLCAAEGL